MDGRQDGASSPRMQAEALNVAGMVPTSEESLRNTSRSLFENINIPNQVRAEIERGMTGDLDSCLEYLEILDRLRNAVTVIEEELANGKSLISKATSMLIDEFRQLLQSGSIDLDIDELRQSTMEEDAPDYAQPPELMDPTTTIKLGAIAQRLISNGCSADCIKFFKDKRSMELRRNLEKLGVQRMVRAEIYSRPWEELEKKMKSWNEHMHLGIILVAGERNLCDQVFRGLDPYREQCFLDLSTPSILWLLSFGEAVTGIRLSPEKLFAFLDMYETVVDLQQTIEELFTGSPEGMSVRQEYRNLLTGLGKAARETFEEFEKVVKEVPVEVTANSSGNNDANHNGSSSRYEHDGPSTPKSSVSQSSSVSRSDSIWRWKGFVPSQKRGKARQVDALSEAASEPTSQSPNLNGDGRVHAITSYVVNYVKLLCNSKLPYFGILKAVFMGSMEGERNETRAHGKLAHSTSRILDALTRNLEIRAAALKDDELADIFLMNNLDYMLSKLEGSDALKLLGVAWVGNYGEKVEQHRDNYIRKALSRFEEVWCTVPLEYSGVAHRLKLFNAAFDTLCHRQNTMTISDPTLRDYVIRVISNALLTNYDQLTNQNRAFVRGIPHHERAEIENMLQDSFPVSKFPKLEDHKH